jgi:hypothetical protein
MANDFVCEGLKGWATFVTRPHLNLLTVILAPLRKSATAADRSPDKLRAYEFRSFITAHMRAAIKAGENLWLSSEETKPSTPGSFPRQHWRTPTNR